MASRNLTAYIPIGRNGLNAHAYTENIPPTDLIQAVNITYENGTIQKEGGASKYNSTAVSGAPKILAGIDYWPDTVTQRMVIYTDGGKLLKDDGSGAFSTTLASGLSTSVVNGVFVEGGKEAAANNRKLFFFNGSDATQVLSGDGATTAALTTPPADWATHPPLFGLIHEGRLWGGGNTNDPGRLYYSITTDHEDFTSGDAGSIAVYPGEGGAMTAAISWKGYIIVFKEFGIYIVDTTDPTITNWKVRRHSSRIGCYGAYAIVDDDIWFLDQTGLVRSISSIQEYGSIGTQTLTDTRFINTWIYNNVNWLVGYNKARIVHYPTKREVHIAYPGSGATDNSVRLVVYLPGMKFRECDRDTPISMWTRLTNNRPELIIGDDSGFVWKMDTAARNMDSSGYEGKFQIPHVDLSWLDQSLGVRRKEGKFLELMFEPLGNWDLVVDILWDGVIKDTVYFNMGVDSAALGSFVLGTDKLGGAGIGHTKKRITGGGRHFSIIGRNSGVDQDFSIDGCYLHFTVGDERI